MSLHEDIKAFIDGELSPGRAAEVRAALDSDPALKKEYQEMKSISEKLSSLVRQPQVMGAEKALANAAPRRRLRWVEGLVAAAALVVLAMVLFPTFAQSKFSAKRAAFNDSGADAVAGETPFTNGRAQKRMEGVDKQLGAASTPYSANELRQFESSSGSPKDVDTGVGNKARDAGRGASTGETTGGGGRMPETLTSKPLAHSPSTLAAKVLDEERYRSEAGRLVIKDATFSIQVASVKKAMDDATQFAKVQGGYVESSSVSDSEDVPKPSGSMVLRVPQKNFETIVSRLRSAGRVTSENSSGDDVTAEVADIEARVKTLTAQEESYRALLRNAKKTTDILEITDRISEIRQEIESYNAQRLTMARLAALSTISVQFTEEKKASDAPKPNNWFEDTKVSAMLMLKGVGRFVAQAATYLFVLVPVWLPVVLFLLWFRRRGMVSAPLSSAGEGKG